MNNFNGRVKKLEALVGPPHPAPLRPTESLAKIETILSRVFSALPDRLRVHAERVFRLGEKKTDEEARVMLDNMILARKLRGGNNL